MFAGKSTYIMIAVRKHVMKGDRALCVRYQRDNRYSDRCLASHDQFLTEAISASTIEQVIKQLVMSADVIFIDEGQFFKDIYTGVMKLLDAGKHVFVSGLTLDYRRKVWEGSDFHKLFLEADTQTTLHAICFNCPNNAPFTRRLNDKHKQTELIGGSETYAPSCRRCHGIEITPAMLRCYRARCKQLRILNQSK